MKLEYSMGPIIGGSRQYYLRQFPLNMKTHMNPNYTSIRWYVGGTSRPSLTEARVQHIAERLTTVYGGATITRGIGIWTDAQGEVVSETSIIAEVLTRMPNAVELAYALASDFAREFGEQEVLVTHAPVNAEFIRVQPRAA